MSRKNKKAIPSENGPWFPVFKRLFDSPAFNQLNRSAREAYFIILSQKSHYNQEEIICPYSYAKQKMDQHTFAKAIRELVKAGFIKIRRFGGLYRFTNIYRLSNDWEKH